MGRLRMGGNLSGGRVWLCEVFACGDVLKPLFEMERYAYRTSRLDSGCAASQRQVLIVRFVLEVTTSHTIGTRHHHATGRGSHRH